MGLNLKNPEAHQLASELARLTGESMTKAVTQAIRERLERERRRRERGKVAADLMEIGRRCAALPMLDDRTPEEMLYDEHGLPK